MSKLFHQQKSSTHFSDEHIVLRAPSTRAMDRTIDIQLLNICTPLDDLRTHFARVDQELSVEILDCKTV
jgi:hypothetical protein